MGQEDEQMAHTCVHTQMASKYMGTKYLMWAPGINLHSSLLEELFL